MKFRKHRTPGQKGCAALLAMPVLLAFSGIGWLVAWVVG
jgi:hypothetical protein